jgi:mono/diheme cytochrome c family protein
MVSCVTGYLLSISDTYNEAAIFKHQWLGIATTVVGGISYFAYQRTSKFFGAILIVLSILIIITGHYGGSLTHGEDYITASMTSATGNKKVIANVNEVAVYKDIIEPILATKCYSCHGSSKQKGKLRLDLPNYIIEGGEDGKVLTAFEPGSSELINRLLLPTSNEEHMPPKEKPQLTQQEISLLHWWIESGASFTGVVKNTKQTRKHTRHRVVDLFTNNVPRERWRNSYPVTNTMWCFLCTTKPTTIRCKGSCGSCTVKRINPHQLVTNFNQTT